MAATVGRTCVHCGAPIVLTTYGGWRHVSKPDNWKRFCEPEVYDSTTATPEPDRG